MFYISTGLFVVCFFILLKDLGALEKQLFRVEDALEKLEKKIDSKL